VHFELCPIRKAVPHLKSAEFSGGQWIGELALSKQATFLAGILPTLFMSHVMELIRQANFPVQGIYLWTDLIKQSYHPPVKGWCIIRHENNFIVCHDNLLCFSRVCYLPLEEELPAIVRYLLRFGYEEATPVFLLASTELDHCLPEVIHQKVYQSDPLKFQGIKVDIPPLRNLQHLYQWSRKINWFGYGMVFFNCLGTLILIGKIYTLAPSITVLTQQLSQTPTTHPVDEKKIKAFNLFRELVKDQPNPVDFFRRLMPFVRENARITHFHWVASPFRLTLKMELTSNDLALSVTKKLQPLLPEYKIEWKPEGTNSLKGTLIVE
jgi:hypothetical protein